MGGNRATNIALDQMLRRIRLEARWIATSRRIAVERQVLALTKTARLDDVFQVGDATRCSRNCASEESPALPRCSKIDLSQPWPGIGRLYSGPDREHGHV